jgi:putative phage-type endonuclease
MHKIVLTQGTDEWKAWRRDGITATDAVVLFGLNPDMTPLKLWRQKKGLMQEPDLSCNPAVRFGHDNEDVLRKRWEQSRFDFADPACAEWDKNPVFRASFDGLSMKGEPVEFKCPLPDGSTIQDVRENGTESKAFKRYFIQVQHQLLVSEAEKAYLVFMDGDGFIEFEIFRDEGVIASLVARGEEFWRCMVENREPAEDLKSDAYFPREGAEVTEWLQASELWLKSYERIKELEAKIAEEKEYWTRCKTEAEKTLKSLMGDHQKADFGGITASCSVIQGKVDEKKLLKKGVSSDVLEECRKADSVRWAFRPGKSLTPKGMTDKKIEESIENRPQPNLMAWIQ